MTIFRRQPAADRFPPAVPLPRPAVGLNVHDLTPWAVAQCRALRVTHVRWTLYWSLWEDDLYYAAEVREQVAHALASGLDLLIVTDGAPRRYGDHWTARDDLLAAHRAWLHERAREWPTVTWQPWNEVDVAQWTNVFSGAPTSTMAGILYGEYLNSLDPAAIVTAAPGGRIEGGFLDGLCSALTRTVSAVAVHCYGLPPDEDLRQRATYVSRRYQAAPVWCTEFGVSHGEMVGAWFLSAREFDAKQVDVYAAMLASPYAARVYGYALDDPAGRGFHLIAEDGTWRPAAALIAGR